MLHVLIDKYWWIDTFVCTPFYAISNLPDYAISTVTCKPIVMWKNSRLDKELIFKENKRKKKLRSMDKRKSMFGSSSVGLIGRCRI